MNNNIDIPAAAMPLREPQAPAPANPRRARRDRRDPNPNRPQRVPAPQNPNPPPARHLAAVATPGRNDPLDMAEFMVHGGLPMSATRLHPLHAVTTEGYSAIVRETFAELEAQNPQIRRSLPFGMYSYYCQQLLHARMNELNKLNQRPYDEPYDTAVYQSTYQVHPLIRAYLAGLGSFTSPEGEHFRIAPLHTEVNALGHYGQFNPITSEAYQSLSAPAILVAYIDAVLQPAPQQVINWQLPPALTPAPVNGHTWIPNQNILGYERNLPTSIHEKTAYSAFGFALATVPQDMTTKYQLSPSAMAQVSSVIQRIKSFKMTEHGRLPIDGSLTQISFTQVTDATAINFNAQYTSTECDNHSRFNLSPSISAASITTCYRVSKIIVNDFINYLGYTLVDNNALNVRLPIPPALGYAAQVNNNHNRFQSARLNHDWFHSISINRITFLNDCVKQYNIVQPR